MKDIDFDELDKAVNSLMGGLKTQPEQPAAKTLSINTTLKEDEAPAFDNIAQAAEKIGSETIGGPTERTAILAESADAETTILELKDTSAAVTETIPPAQTPVTVPSAAEKSVNAPARSGRFMDVMHPSSDMKTASKKPAVSDSVITSPVLPQEKAPIAEPKNPSREGTTIMPSGSDSFDTVNAAGAEQPTELPTETVEAEQTTQETSPVGTNNVPASDMVEPQVSPFLPDAKVEKRPLGGTAEAAEDELDIDTLDGKKPKDSTDTQLAPDAQNGSELPEELHADLTAIEAHLAGEEQPPTPPETVQSAVATTTPQQSSPATAADQNDQSSADTSLSPAESTGAIFDTTEYHKPVEHAAKQKSGWLWIVLILIIVIICAAGAAAFYLLSA